MDPNVESPRAASTTGSGKHDSAGPYSELQVEAVGEHFFRTGVVEGDSNFEDEVGVPPGETGQGDSLPLVHPT